MTDDQTAPEDDQPVAATERTVAFYADPHAATLLLEPTIASMISSLEIQRGIVDLSTVPGLAIAAAFREAGVPFDSLEYGQEDRIEDGAPTEYDPADLRQVADGIAEVEVADLGTIDANIALVPAAVSTDGAVMDFSQGTLLGAVMSQVEKAERPIVVIVPPERGLQAVVDGMYQRSILHVGGNAFTD